MIKDGAQTTKEELCGSSNGGDEKQEADAATEKGNRAEGREGALGGAGGGHIYFLETEDGRYVKIGFSGAVLRRLSQLRTSHHEPLTLRLLGAMAGSRENERSLHKRFGDERHNGEWFTKSARLAEFIATLPLTPPIMLESSMLAVEKRPHPHEEWGVDVLPKRIVGNRNRIVLLEQATYTDVRRYYKMLSRRHEERRLRDKRLQGAKTLMRRMRTASKKHRGVNVAEALRIT